MGEEIKSAAFTSRDRRDFRTRLMRCREALDVMLTDGLFSASTPQVGMELELNLVNEHGYPMACNAEALHAIGDPAFQTELGRYNIELNVDPHPLTGDSLLALEKDLRASLHVADEGARQVGARLAMIGMLPTITAEHFSSEWISASRRYAMLDNQIMQARGEDLCVDICGDPLHPQKGPEKLHEYYSSIMPEAACTSMQLHIQVVPEDFARYWNSAQAITGIQVALGANSPFFSGKALWHESRIPLFQQATDSRPPEFAAQGVRPRVWFGEKWIESITDLFNENERFFPSLLPECSDQDPLEAMEQGLVPSLDEMRLHNGTVYRWNRPIYATTEVGHHVRIENRVLPAPPTVIDGLADIAFFYGAVHGLARMDTPVWDSLAFTAARDNLSKCARFGLEAQVAWSGNHKIAVRELVVSHLLPIVDDGLASIGVDAQVRDKYLGIIEARANSGRNGAQWQRDCVMRQEAAGVSRADALAFMVREYMERCHDGAPVHTWD